MVSVVLMICMRKVPSHLFKVDKIWLNDTSIAMFSIWTYLAKAVQMVKLRCYCTGLQVKCHRSNGGLFTSTFKSDLSIWVKVDHFVPKGRTTDIILIEIFHSVQFGLFGKNCAFSQILNFHVLLHSAVPRLGKAGTRKPWLTWVKVNFSARLIIVSVLCMTLVENDPFLLNEHSVFSLPLYFHFQHF